MHYTLKYDDCYNVNHFFVVKVLNKWGEYSQDVQFILQRSALDGLKSNATAPTGAPIVQGGNLMSPQLQRANFGGVPGPPAPINNQPGQIRGSGVMTKAQSAEPPAVWKPPPPHGAIAGIYEKTLYLNSFLELTCICDQ